MQRPEFRWVKAILGNIKNALRVHLPCDSSQDKYAQRYLSEFEHRFNPRRFDLPDIIRETCYVASSGHRWPMPERRAQVTLSLPW